MFLISQSYVITIFEKNRQKRMLENMRIQSPTVIIHAHSTTREDISLPVSQFDSSEPSEHCGYPSHRHHTGTQLPSWHWKSPDVHVLPQCGSIFFPVQNISLLSQKSEGLSFPIVLAKANGSSCSYLDHLPSKDFDPSKGVL